MNEYSVAYVVRIINIPADYVDVDITANPYAIIEDADGNEIVKYFTAKTASYSGN